MGLEVGAAEPAGRAASLTGVQLQAEAGDLRQCPGCKLPMLIHSQGKSTDVVWARKQLRLNRRPVEEVVLSGVPFSLASYYTSTSTTALSEA